MSILILTSFPPLSKNIKPSQKLHSFTNNHKFTHYIASQKYSQHNQLLFQLAFDSLTTYLTIKVTSLSNIIPVTINSNDLSKILINRIMTNEIPLKIDFYNGQISALSIEKLTKGHFERLKYNSKSLQKRITDNFLSACKNYLCQFTQDKNKVLGDTQKSSLFKKLLDISSIKSNFQYQNQMCSFNDVLQNELIQKQQILFVKKDVQIFDIDFQPVRLYHTQRMEDYSHEKIAKFQKQFNLLVTNFSSVYQENISQEQKKKITIEDFNFNTISLKHQAKGPTFFPFSSGGSAEIYLANLKFSFINSQTFESYENDKNVSEKMIAVKKIKKTEEKFLYKIHHENKIVSLLKGQRSKYLPKYYGVEEGTNFTDNVLMEMIEGFNLSIHLELFGYTTRIQTKLMIIFNVIRGLRVLSLKKITNLDIKPWNIMVSKGLITKIIDYGESYHKSLCDKNFKHGYTYPYIAPETMKRRANPTEEPDFEFSQKQDVFSMGHVIAGVIFNSLFFRLSNKQFQEIYVGKSYMDFMYLSPERLQDYGQKDKMFVILQLIMKCIEVKPENRPFIDWIGVLVNQLYE